MQYSMFSDAVTFNQDLRDWDVSRVSSMRHMFRNAEDYIVAFRRWYKRLCESLFWASGT